MNYIKSPSTVSFEDALRNLASRLTGVPVSKLPRTQERIVQFMAENVPSANDFAEAVTKEVLAKLGALQEEAQEAAETVEVVEVSTDDQAAKNGSESAVEAKISRKKKSTE